MRARTIKLLSVLDSFSRWVNWGAHAEYAYCTDRSAMASDVVSLYTRLYHTQVQ